MSPLTIDDYISLRERCERYRGIAFKLREAMRECLGVLTESPSDAATGIPRDIKSTVELESWLREAAEAWRAMNDAYAALTDSQRASVVKPLLSLA